MCEEEEDICFKIQNRLKHILYSFNFSSKSTLCAASTLLYQNQQTSHCKEVSILLLYHTQGDSVLSDRKTSSQLFTQTKNQNIQKMIRRLLRVCLSHCVSHLSPSERQSSLGHAPHEDPQSHYDLPVNSHIPGHYDLPPVRRPPSPRRTPQ